MELLLIVAAVVLYIGLPALAGAYIIKEGINQAIEWKEQYQEEQKKKKKKENQDNAEL